MKLLFSEDWLRRKLAENDDSECAVGTDAQLDAVMQALALQSALNADVPPLGSSPVLT